MELKDYQENVLNSLNCYLEELYKQKENSLKVIELIEANPKLKISAPNYCSDTWDELKLNSILPPIRKSIPYSTRLDGTGRYVPNICLKIPTGGGKTILATTSVARIFSRYLSSNTGMVLWIMPNEAIYSQTKKCLNDRDHPYRHILDRAAAGKVKILEKDDPLDKKDQGYAVDQPSHYI